MLTRGQLKVNTQIMSSDKALRQLGGIIDRMSMATVIAQSVYRFVGGVLMHASSRFVFGIPVIGFYGLRECAGAGAYAGSQYLALTATAAALEAATVTAFSYRKQ